MAATSLTVVLALALKGVPPELRSAEVDQALEAFEDDVAESVDEFMAGDGSALDLDFAAFGRLAQRCYETPGYQAIASTVAGFLAGWLGALGQADAVSIEEVGGG